MDKNIIWKTRIAKEKETLKKYQHDKIKAEFLENDEALLLTFDVSGFSVCFILDFPEDFPFACPELKLLSCYGLDSITDLSHVDSPLEFIMCEHWLPVMNLAQIIDSLHLYVQQSFKPVEKSLILDIFHISPRFRVSLMLLLVLVTRVLVINFPHMDWNNFPDFGPYEKFRNAMEITQNIPIQSWYHPEVIQEIKAPPLFAYFSYLFSYFSLLVDPESIELKTDPGYQSVEQKGFMRISVIFLEVFFMIWPVFSFFKRFYKNLMKNVQLAAVWLIFTSPAVVIVGHLFFSLCEVNFGLLVLAIFMLLEDKFELASFFLALSFGFSVEGAFEVLIVFFLIFWLVVEKVRLKSEKILRFKRIFLVSETVLQVLSSFLSFFCPLALLSAPWLLKLEVLTIFNPESVIRVKFPSLFGLFLELIPLNKRFLFQFSVHFLFDFANFYLIFKQKSIRSRVYLSLFLPSLINYLLSTSPIQNSILMINLIFSLFNMIETPEIFSLFSMISAFTLYPQTILDGSRMAYFVSTLIFYILSHYFSKSLNYLSGRPYSKQSLFYILMLSIHLLEIVNQSLFLQLHQIFSSLFLLFFYFWVFKSHFSSIKCDSGVFSNTVRLNKNKKT